MPKNESKWETKDRSENVEYAAFPHFYLELLGTCPRFFAITYDDTIGKLHTVLAISPESSG